MKEYMLLDIKKIEFISGGAFGEFYNLNGVKYYVVKLDIAYEDGGYKEELYNLSFYFSQENLDKLLLTKKINYDREKREFEIE